MPAARYPQWSWVCELADDLPGAHAADHEVWDAVVLRIGDKMFGLLCEDGRGRELLTLKLPPDDGEALRRAHAYVEPGWHLNKRHWTSVVLAHAERSLVEALVEDAHACLLETLPRWRQREVLTGVPRP